VLRVCEVLDVEPDEVFDRRLYGGQVPSAFAIPIGPQQLAEAGGMPRLPPAPEEATMAAERRKCNERRREAAQWRRQQVFDLLLTWEWRRGVQRRLAERLGVHPSVISRDLAALRQRFAL
jgi:hypothetical protein